MQLGKILGTILSEGKYIINLPTKSVNTNVGNVSVEATGTVEITIPTVQVTSNVSDISITDIVFNKINFTTSELNITLSDKNITKSETVSTNVNISSPTISDYLTLPQTTTTSNVITPTVTDTISPSTISVTSNVIAANPVDLVDINTIQLTSEVGQNINIYTSQWEIETETGGPGFKVGDIIESGRLDFALDGTETSVYNLLAVVDEVLPSSEYGGDTYVLNFATTTSLPLDIINEVINSYKEGMEFIRRGNTTDTDRQDSILIASDFYGSPFIDVLDGVNSTNDILGYDYINPDKIKVRLGKLDGLTGLISEFPTMSGYGLYSENVYLTGEVNITGGSADTDFGATMYSATEPTTRPSGNALQQGDKWIDTANDNEPYTYSGSSWIRDYTQIDGGYLITGSVTANEIDVDDLFATNANVTGILTIGDGGSDGILQSYNFVTGSAGWRVDYNGDAEFNSVTVRNGNIINPSSGTSKSILGWTTNIDFTAEAYNQIKFTNGNITFSNGESTSIVNGGIKTITGRTFFYYNGTASIQTTSSETTAIGQGKILLCVADINSDTDKLAEFQVFGGRGGIGKMITADYIAADTITANEIFANTITANEIAASTITADEIATGTITANEIAASTITADEIATGTITANEIAAGTITADEIAAGTITANEIDVDNLFAQDITATGSITGATIQTSSSGKRVVLNDSDNSIDFYDSDSPSNKISLYGEQETIYTTGEIWAADRLRSKDIFIGEAVDAQSNPAIIRKTSDNSTILEIINTVSGRTEMNFSVPGYIDCQTIELDGGTLSVNSSGDLLWNGNIIS
jgi:hypothetical protein